jgi:hypothetical protein
LLTRFVTSHAARLLREPGAALACFALAVASVVAYRGGGAECSAGEHPGAYGAFVCYASAPFVFLLPAVAATIGGTLVATSRARGDDVVYGVRGLRGARLSVGRLLAGSGAAALLVLLTGLALIVVALLFLPHRPELDSPPGVTALAGSHPPEPGVPSPSLWRSAPLAGDLLAVLIYAWAAAALAAVGNAIGQLVAQPLAAFAAPVFLVLVTQVAPVSGPARWLSGYAYLDLGPTAGTMTEVPGSWRLAALLGYWGAVLLMSFVIATLVATRQAAAA